MGWDGMPHLSPWSNRSLTLHQRTALAPAEARIKRVSDPNARRVLWPQRPHHQPRTPSSLPPPSLAIWEVPSLEARPRCARSSCPAKPRFSPPHCSPPTVFCPRLWENLHHAGHRP